MMCACRPAIAKVRLRPNCSFYSHCKGKLLVAQSVWESRRKLTRNGILEIAACRHGLGGAFSENCGRIVPYKWRHDDRENTHSFNKRTSGTAHGTKYEFDFFFTFVRRCVTSLSIDSIIVDEFNILAGAAMHTLPLTRKL